YGVSVSLTNQKVPLPRFSYQILFETDTDRIDELLPLVSQELEALSVGGATDEEVVKTKEFFLKKYRDGLIHNGTWLGYISNWYQNETDRYTGYEAAVQSLTPESIRQAASEAFGQNNVCTLIQLPTQKSER
ncbi:MAG: hypothetical protein K2K83_04785, partial [Rikenella sp.]|nr:hypothetical protein [Rikenella sp.]